MIVTIAAAYYVWSQSGWNAWRKAPAILQGTYERINGGGALQGPEQLILDSTEIRFMARDAAGDWVIVDDFNICKGITYREKMQHNIWFPECGRGERIEVYELPDRSLEIHRITILTHTADEIDEFTSWQGIYRKTRVVGENSQ